MLDASFPSWFDKKNCSICKGRAERIVYLNNNFYFVCKSKICYDKIYIAEGWIEGVLNESISGINTSK
jgi:hypothetical protein